MPGGTEDWIRLAADEPLPQLRKTSQALLRLARYTDPDLAKIVEVIRQDCGYTIQLLRRLSELKTKRQVSEVSTLERAVVMVGSGRALSLAKELPLVEELLVGEQLAGYMKVAARSYHASRQAFEWARLRGDSAPDEMCLAALLHDLAELVLWRFGKQEMLSLEQSPPMESFDENAQERLEIEVLGFAAMALGRELAKRWQLPSMVHICMNPISALEPRLLGPIFAAKMARAVQQGWYYPAALELVGMAGDYLSMSSAKGATRVHTTAVEVSRAVQFHGVTPLAAGLLYSGNIPQIIAKPRQKARAVETAGEIKKSQVDMGETPAVTIPSTSDLSVYHRALERLNREDLGGHAILETAMNGLHAGLGLQRVLFAILTPEKDALRIRHALGVSGDSRFKEFSLPLSPPHIFTRLMQKPQALWLHERNSANLSRYVPKAMRDLIKVKTFFVMSIFSDGKPVGMLYADKAVSGDPLDQAGFIGFKSVCTLTGQALGRAKSSAKAQKKSA